MLSIVPLACGLLALSQGSLGASSLTAASTMVYRAVSTPVSTAGSSSNSSGWLYQGLLDSTITQLQGSSTPFNNSFATLGALTSVDIYNPGDPHAIGINQVAPQKVCFQIIYHGVVNDDEACAVFGQNKTGLYGVQSFGTDFPRFNGTSISYPPLISFADAVPVLAQAKVPGNLSAASLWFSKDLYYAGQQYWHFEMSGQDSQGNGQVVYYDYNMQNRTLLHASNVVYTQTG